MNYRKTFIQIAPDCPIQTYGNHARRAEVAPRKALAYFFLSLAPTCAPPR